MKKLTLLFSLFIITSCLFGQTKVAPKNHFSKKKLETMLTEKPEGFKTARKASSDGESSEAEGAEVLMNYNSIFYDSSNPAVTKAFADFDDLSTATIFTIYVSDTLKEQELWRIRTPEVDISLTTIKAYNNDLMVAYESTSKSGAYMSTVIQNYKPIAKKASNKDNFIEFGTFSGNSTKALKGKIAEILVYTGVLGTNTKQIIESGLSLKYGIGLENESDYLSSEEVAIYSLEKSPTYKNRIFGVGRDDWNGVYQKQTRMSHDKKEFIVSLGEVAVSNEANTTLIDDQNFLIFGDNDGALALKSSEDLENCVPMLGRRWMVQATGSQSRSLKTVLSFDTSLFEKEMKAKDYLLVIDKSNEGTFLPENLSYITANTIEEGKVFFKDLSWDADNSGKDFFGITQRLEMKSEVKEFACVRCDRGNSGVLSYLITGGRAPYKMTLKEKEVVVKEWTEKKFLCSEQTIDSLKAGVYTLSVKDVLGEEKSQIYDLKEPLPVTVELGQGRKLGKDAQEIAIEPIVQTEGETTYSWTSSSDEAFKSDTSKITITKSGVYTLVVTNEKGCTATDSVVIKDEWGKKMVIYPTVSYDGNFNLDVTLDKKEHLEISMFDILGKMIYYKITDAEGFLSIPIHIKDVAGVYLISVKDTSTEEVVKLIIK